MWRAYVDESESNRRLDPDTYILAAALIDDDEADGVRRVVAELRPPGTNKLHWHAESARSRRAIIKTVAELPALHVVVVRRGRTGEATERRRRKCFEQLAHELGERGVVHITAEARERKSNTREVRHFNDLRSAQRIPTEMRLFHIEGPAEPLLWIADAVAGAVASARLGTPVYLDKLSTCIDVILLEL